MKKAWSLTRGVIAMDGPTPLGKYLGCGHRDRSRSTGYDQGFMWSHRIALITALRHELKCVWGGGSPMVRSRRRL